MDDIDLVLLGLMVAVAGFSVLARWISVPYPILLVLGGLVLGFVPGIPAVDLPPELVLVAFLPPLLLYWSGFFSSPRELRADARPISLMAVAPGPGHRRRRGGGRPRPGRRPVLGGGVRAGRDRLADRPTGRHRHRPSTRGAAPPDHAPRG